MRFDEFDEVLDAKVGERHDTSVVNTVDPDHASSVSNPKATSKSQSPSSPSSLATRSMVLTLGDLVDGHGQAA